MKLVQISEPSGVDLPPRPVLDRPAASAVHLFGDFELQPEARRLLCHGQPVAVGGRAFGVLVALWERRARAVSKNELMGLVWPDVVVEENNLQVQVSSLRKLLGPRAISTIPGRGYRFTAEADTTATARSPASAARQPPQPLPPMRGREDDLAVVLALSDRHSLVTVIGAGGIGKTLLARHVLAAAAEAGPHGVCWVELAPLAGPGQVVAALVEALGIDPGPGDPLQGLCAALAPMQWRVVLDNAEHLLAEVADVVRALLGAAPGLRLLVTSQAPLLLAEERAYRIGPLAVPDGPLPAAEALRFSAVALFVERARAVDARFVLTDRLAAEVGWLCGRLDGLPLAIELAAARAPMLGVHRLGELLHDRLHLLNHSRNRDAPPRQQTLQAALAWSHDLLDAHERAVFRRLAVFSGSASLEALQAVVSDTDGPLDPWAALDALGTLVDRSLVTVIADDDEAPRYRLPHSARAYALERLQEAGEADAVGRRHALAVADPLISPARRPALPSRPARRRAPRAPSRRAPRS